MHPAGLLLAVSAVAIGGCTLIDQRTFERAGTAPSAAQIARSAEAAAARQNGGAPLLTVFPGDLARDWRPDVQAAVRNALVRRPDAAFDVVTPVPTAQGPDAERAATVRGGADAAAVVAVMQAAGVAAERLHIGARGDAGRPAREVLIYLR